MTKSEFWFSMSSPSKRSCNIPQWVKTWILVLLFRPINNLFVYQMVGAWHGHALVKKLVWISFFITFSGSWADLAFAHTSTLCLRTLPNKYSFSNFLVVQVYSIHRSFIRTGIAQNSHSVYCTYDRQKITEVGTFSFRWIMPFWYSCFLLEDKTSLSQYSLDVKGSNVREGG